MTNFKAMSERVCQDDYYCCAPSCKCPKRNEKISSAELDEIKLSLKELIKEGKLKIELSVIDDFDELNDLLGCAAFVTIKKMIKDMETK